MSKLKVGTLKVSDSFQGDLSEKALGDKAWR
jgi:hypothetical protein